MRPAGRRRTVHIDGREVFAPPLVADVDNAFGGVEHAVPGVAGRQHAVEHIDAAADALQNIFRRTDAHEVAGFVGGQYSSDQLGHGVHILHGFAHRQTADGVAFAAEGGDRFGRGPAQIGVGAALHDGEKSLRITVLRPGTVETLHTAGQPAVGQLHGLFSVIVLAGVRRTLVEGHDDVGADGALDVHHAFRRERVFGAVDVALEGDAFLFDLAPMRQRVHLKAAAIGQDRSLPAIEAVQTAGFLQHLQAGAQVKVIGVAQTNLCLNVVDQLMLMHCLDRGRRTDGHEDRCLNRAVIGLDAPGAGAGLGVGMLERESQTCGKLRKGFSKGLAVFRKKMEANPALNHSKLPFLCNFRIDFC